MTVTGTGPIKRGVVRRIRSSGPLKAALVGGIHQSLAARNTPYPYVVYTEVSAPFIRDWGTTSAEGGREIQAVYDIVVYASNTVDAQNIDQLIDTLFDGADRELDPLVDGQRVFYCARISNVPGGPDRDDEGRYVVMIGGTYEIHTEQRITPTTSVAAGTAVGAGAAGSAGP